jgi:hypothetical protein
MVKTRRKRKTRCRCAKSRCTCRHGGRRSHRGGGHPLAATAGTFPALPFAPPGGMYKPGAVNGLDGGYYYGVNVDQSLPDPISTCALFRQAGGRRRRRKRKTRRPRRKRKTRRRRKRKTRRRRKRKTRRRRKKRKVRRRQRGGRPITGSHNVPTGIKSFLTTIIPKDILDIGYKGGNKMGNLYRGYVGERPKMSPVPYTNQPINQPINTNTIRVNPVDAVGAYNQAINAVNTGNTIKAQASY